MCRHSWAFLLRCLLAWLAASVALADITATVNSDRVNVRGRPSLLSEVISQLRQGETVTVLESLSLERPSAGTPAEWLKISLPTNTPVWVNAGFVDPATKTIRARRLNVRAGPGENFSVVGQLAKGDVVHEIRIVDDWMEIETPPGAFGFVAASFLTAAPAAAPTAAEPTPPATPPAPPTTAGVTVDKPTPAPTTPEPTAPAPTAETPAAPPKPEPATPPAAPTEPTAKPPAPADAPASPPTPAAPAPNPAAPAAVTPTARRIVSREGIVADTLSIQAPTDFQLKATDTGKSINYLLPGSPDLRLSRYRGKRVTVTGEELIEPRWPNLPMIEVQTIDLSP